MELQILRTRHPPEIYLSQLTALLDRELPYSDVEQVSQRIEELPKDDRLLLAVLGETLLGFAHLRIAHSLAYNPSAEVVSIIVREQNRRQGIGRRLVAAAETWARQSGRAYLLLHTDVTRTPAHAFYTALGYQKSSTSVEFVRDLDLK
ncbi:MAG: GNAT family N-acetyltransferase [Anaerolineales bacterium]|jgi:GNAT superfamily N-acetyltransferase